MENLRRLLTPRPTPQTTTIPVTANHQSSATSFATQTGEPEPATSSTAAQLDETDNSSGLLSYQPYAFPTHNNETSPSFQIPPLLDDPEFYQSHYNPPQHDNYTKLTFEEECASSDDGEDDLRQASMTSETQSSWGAATVMTETNTSFL
jgi:hypothetical protein